MAELDVHAKVQAWLNQFDLGLKIIDTPENTATAELAAEALGTEVGQIAKSLLFRIGDDEYAMVVTAGDVKVRSGKLKAVVGSKPRMASVKEVQKVTGYSIDVYKRQALSTASSSGAKASCSGVNCSRTTGPITSSASSAWTEP